MASQEAMGLNTQVPPLSAQHTGAGLTRRPRSFRQCLSSMKPSLVIQGRSGTIMPVLVLPTETFLVVKGTTT